MIKSISIRNYKSFHPTTPCVIPIDTQKPVALFYGLNGAGKSAIGEVIHGRANGHADFADCAVTPTDGGGHFRYLVYNHAFVGRVIGETMQGIFTIGEMDTAKQQRIDEIDASLEVLETELATSQQREAASETLVAGQKRRGIDEVWKAHEMGRKTKLADLLKGYGNSKEKFFTDLRGSAAPAGTEIASIAGLEERWADASSAETEKSAPVLDLSGLEAIETDTLWAEPIGVSATSRLAQMIADLGNADWVERGQKFIKDDACPFCQEGLPHDFKDELHKLLEGNRKLKIDRLDSLVLAYEQRLAVLQTRMTGVFDDTIVKGTGLDLAWSKFEGAMKDRLVLMHTKQTKPSESIFVDSIDQIPLVDALAALKAKVEDFNERIKDRKSEQARIRKEFWQLLRADRQDAYSTHDAALAPLEAQLEADRASVKAAKDQITASRLELSELKKAQTGVDASVVQINRRLTDLGIHSFGIKRKEGEGHLYCLARPNSDGCNAMSLSEGEKTLISFLYFMELIKGNHEEHGVSDVSKTIVVVDDPISSLSQNYVYDIATIIYGELIKPPAGATKVRQAIVLTHNLFFFHELIRQMGVKLENAGSRCQMMRVYKSDYSNVVPLDPTQYLNDYDALWQVLKDAKTNPALVRAVPNSMRCILEQFFAFTGRERDFTKALKELLAADPSPKLKALERYLDRGSHKDAINGVPMDWSIYDVDYYLTKMRALMKAIDHEDHFLQRMGEMPAVEEASAA